MDAASPSRGGDNAPSTSVGVVIVSYRSAAHLADCIARLTHPAVEIVVVDNGSSDDSAVVAEQAGAAVVEVGTNSGYAYACNRGVEAMTGTHPWLAFVNPDVRLAGEDLIRATIEVPADVDVFSPLMLDGSGEPQRDLARPEPSVGRIARLYLLSSAAEISAKRHYRRLLQARERFVETEVTSGSSLVIRRAKLEELGGWSENFFLDMEDVDLCCRVRRAGGKIVIDRGIHGSHQKFTSSAGARSDVRSLETARSEVIYFAVNRPRWEAYVVALAVCVGTTARQVIRTLATARLGKLPEIISLQRRLASVLIDVLRTRGATTSRPPRAAFP